VQNIFGLTISQMPNGKEAIEGVATHNKDKREEDLHPLNKAKLQAEIDKLEAERDPSVKLSDKAQTNIDESVEKSMEASLAASQASNLADAFDALQPKSGWGAKWADSLKEVAGNQDIFTALKQQYIKLKNTTALKNLPPGAASDEDIKAAMASFPSETSNPKEISSFLKGVAKLEGYTAAVEKAKSEWINQNGGLGPARVEFVAGGQTVKKGMDFFEFSKKIAIPNVVDVKAKPAPSGGAGTAPAAEKTVTGDK